MTQKQIREFMGIYFGDTIPKLTSRNVSLWIKGNNIYVEFLVCGQAKIIKKPFLSVKTFKSLQRLRNKIVAEIKIQLEGTEVDMPE